ncbi:MAG: cysteine hydrolase family protein [Variibacter sp.]
MRPKTLLEMAGATTAPPDIANCTVVVIDAQREYVDGALPLPGVKGALAEIAKLLDRARHLGAPVIHVKHRGKAGGAFDPDATRGHIADEVSPADGEAIVEKTLPNSFAGTDLKARLDALGRKDLVLAGFMTHMCVEATARSALDHGFKVAVLASGTATRDLPDALSEGTIPAAEVQRNALTALSDRFATIVRDTEAFKT